jgi:hypothetical protein
VAVIRERHGNSQPPHHGERNVIDNSRRVRLATLVSIPCLMSVGFGRPDESFGGFKFQP